MLIFGVLMLVQYLVYPFLQSALPEQWIAQAVSITLCIVGVALFIRPMLDLHSTEYTVLWVKNRYYRLPLIAMTALRFVLIVLIVFFPLQAILDLGDWILVLIIAAAILLIYRSGWMSSAYVQKRASWRTSMSGIFSAISVAVSQMRPNGWTKSSLFRRWTALRASTVRH